MLNEEEGLQDESELSQDDDLFGIHPLPFQFCLF